jgi:hypothetical protein
MFLQSQTNSREKKKEPVNEKEVHENKKKAKSEDVQPERKTNAV